MAEEAFPQAAGVLDFYRSAERIAAAVTAGEQADGLYAGGRSALLTGGKAGLERWIGEAFLVLPAGSDGEPLRALAAYVAPHPTHLVTRSGWRRVGASAAARWRGRSSRW